MFLLDITIQPDPMVCPQGENGVHILSFDVLKNLRRASVLVLTRRRTLNPKTLNPKALKTLSLKAEKGILNVAVRANHGVCAVTIVI